MKKSYPKSTTGQTETPFNTIYWTDKAKQQQFRNTRSYFCII